MIYFYNNHRGAHKSIEMIIVNEKYEIAVIKNCILDKTTKIASFIFVL